MLAHMDFDGQRLRWNGIRFKATIGFKGFQHPAQQCTPEYGPIPEGFYKVYLSDKAISGKDLPLAWCGRDAPQGARSAVWRATQATSNVAARPSAPRKW